MNSQQVEAFRAVMLCGSMTAAASELYTSQPTISRLIKELETASGLQLFDRQGGRVHPTAEGLAFFKEVQLYFNGIESLQKAATRILSAANERIRIATTPALSFGFLPIVIDLFRQSFPQVAITFHTGRAETVMYRLMAGACDVGFVPSMPDGGGVVASLFYQYDGLCALPATHPLCHVDVIRPEHLIDEDFISLTSDNAQRFQIDKIFNDARVHRNLIIEAQYGTSVCVFVERGLGLSIVNPITAQDHRNPRIVFRPFEPSVQFTGNLLVPEHRQGNVLISRFCEIAKAQMEQYCSVVLAEASAVRPKRNGAKRRAST